MAASNGSEYFEMEVESGRESFARQSNAERDEEDLMWAALSRLPSRKRPNFAILRRSNPDGDDQQQENLETVDVRKLSRSVREQVVQKALATTEQDNYKLLSAIKERLDRVGLDIPKVEVRFENLKISANVQTGKRALPTLVNYTRDMLEYTLTQLRIFRPKRKSMTILDDISGYVKPGR